MTKKGVIFLHRKKFVSLAVAIIFLLTSVNFSSAAPPLQELENLRQHQKQILQPSQSLSQKHDEALEDSDVVRVAVELEKEPIIYYATLSKKDFNKLDKDLKKQIKDEIKAEQKAVKELMKQKGIKFKELESFTNVVNGFSIETTYGEAKLIKNLNNVKNVSIVNEYERPAPELVTSKDIINAREVWNNLTYTGEGTVIAIIDTGVDVNHRDMVLTNPENAKIKSTVDLTDFPGTYRTIKVPYGYNYMDKNQEILDLGPYASEHGMHVAGIAAANGDEDNGGVKGIAKEAQILAMKVFGNNPALSTTYGDIIVKAIDDSVALGADTINMSLGSTASFVDDQDLEQVAIKNAVENGIVCAVSAGNSARFGNGWDDPYTSNPDIGVVGAPGLATDSIQVASVENTHQMSKTMMYREGGLEHYIAMAVAGKFDPIDYYEGPVEYVDGGSGHPSELTNVAGKIALEVRGGLTPNFVDKISNAQKAGAIGIIVYNHQAGGEALVNMATPDDLTIPAMFIGNSGGLKLLSLQEKFVEFTDKTMLTLNPNFGKMSDFTSWGTTPDLRLKPEITAPGGAIYSTAQNNKYQSMSGTSMSAPHVAGGSSLILQRVDEEFALEGEERAKLAKNLIMSTAKPLGDKGLYNSYYGLTDYNYTSPRRQGAGTMDLLSASITPAIVVDPSTGVSKVELGEISYLSSFVVRIQNFSDKDISYKLKGTVQTDLADANYNYLESQGVYIADTVEENGPNGYWTGEFPITFSQDIVNVPANGHNDVLVTIDLSNAVDWFYNVPLEYIFPNGTFIEGFITFDDVADENPTLSIPYMGFFGEWDKAPILDDNIYDLDGNPFYGVTALAWLNEIDQTYYFLGFDALGNIDEKYISFSPNGDGVYDTVVPILSFLRNAKDFEINILDEEMNVVRELAKQTNLRKNYYDASDPYFTSYGDWGWDGTINNKLSKDGQYYYEIKAKVDYPNADWQVYTFPVKLDNTKPVIEDVVYDETENKLTVTANDNGNQIFIYELYTKGQLVSQSLDGVFDLNGVSYGMKSEVVVVDFANNSSSMTLEKVFKGINPPKADKEKPQDPQEPEIPEIPEEAKYEQPVVPKENDTTIPTVMIENPEFFEILNNNKVALSGYIKDESNIEYLKVDANIVKLDWDEINNRWNFTTEIFLEDGLHSINIEALDGAGNKISFAHKIFVDSTAPTIELIDPIPKQTKLDTLIIRAKVNDNLPSLKVYINQNIIANISPDWSYFDELNPAEYIIEYELKLNKGKNEIVIEAIDDAGNKVIKEYKINKN
jgi:lactocepin